MRTACTQQRQLQLGAKSTAGGLSRRDKSSAKPPCHVGLLGIIGDSQCQMQPCPDGHFCSRGPRLGITRHAVYNHREETVENVHEVAD